jgi:hypothetical protein
MGHECEGRRVWGKSVRKGEKERILRGEENWSIYMCVCVYVCVRQYNKTYQTLVEIRWRREEGWEMEGWTYSKYTVHKYGVITMKLPYIIFSLFRKYIQEKVLRLYWEEYIIFIVAINNKNSSVT